MVARTAVQVVAAVIPASAAQAETVAVMTSATAGLAELLRVAVRAAA